MPLNSDQLNMEKSQPYELLLMYRNRTGLTRAEMAARLGLKSFRMLQYWEGDYSLPKPQHLRKLLEIFVQHRVFMPGKELAEAGQLWQAVKKSFDARPDSYRAYPIFDAHWFAALLESPPPAPDTFQTITVVTREPEPEAEADEEPEATPAEPQTPPRHNLFRQLSSFVGRQHEKAELQSLLTARAGQLVTLTGPGGAGKTRLSLEVAAGLVENYADGVWLVELAPVNDPALLPQVIAAALEIADERGRPSQATLIKYLENRQLLLVLDNCEHLVADCARLAENLLRNCPGLTIFASSRESLGISGEVNWPLGSLSLLPQEDGLTVAETLANSEAARLFYERARDARPDFELTEADLPALGQVCRQVNGLPLALELAAARVKMLPLEQIALRLEDSFRLLTAGSRTVLPRHQTIRALIDWSYHLLAEAEKVLLNRLAVFAGGWTLEAIEKICAWEGGVVEEWEVLDLLGRLVNKSLVVVDRQGATQRYGLLETIRQYALEKLTESGELDDLRQRHLDYFLGVAETAGPALTGPEQVRWFNLFEAEHDNLRAALSWAYDTGQEFERLEKGFRLAVGLAWFWFVRAYLQEGRDWLEKFYLAYSKRVPQDNLTYFQAELEVKALYGFLTISWSQQDFTSLDFYGGTGLALARKYEVNDLLPLIMPLLGFSQASRGVPTGPALVAESYRLIATISNRWQKAVFHYFEATARLQQGDAPGAERLYRQSLEIFQELGDRRFEGLTAFFLGRLELYRHDYAAAEAFFKESLARLEEVGERRGSAWARLGLGFVAIRRQEYEQAEKFCQESLRLFQKLSLRSGAANSLEGLAHVAAGLETSPEAAEQVVRLAAQADALWKTVKGSTLYAVSPGETTALLKKAHVLLGEETYWDTWQAVQKSVEK